MPLWLGLLLLLSARLTWPVILSRVHRSSPLTSHFQEPGSIGPRASDGDQRAFAEDYLSELFTPQVLAWSEEIFRWARQHQLDPNLIALVMQLESCGDPTARSPAGAMGLFQVMPFHFAADEDPLDPETNAKRGLDYLARALASSDSDPVLALAAYNGGHMLLARPPETWPDETKRYVAWASSILGEVALRQGTSPTLAAWMSAGGKDLCSSASRVLATALIESTD